MCTKASSNHYAVSPLWMLRTPLQGLWKSTQGLCSAHFTAWGEGSDKFYLILQYPKGKAPMWCTSTQETLVFATEFVFLKAKHQSMTVSHKQMQVLELFPLCCGSFFPPAVCVTFLSQWKSHLA